MPFDIYRYLRVAKFQYLEEVIGLSSQVCAGCGSRETSGPGVSVSNNAVSGTALMMMPSVLALEPTRASQCPHFHFLFRLLTLRVDE
ncbi:hypothetical protein RRG08_040185 [Elysia crispata]|uniref:Uncharacterized protein n=1 Tax=Elysia crispata TaxID=231223 RepID=A0AAE1CN57_9GAST|nr:hypothetical protein RRG08_040185 [Elysia crispata]